MGRPKKYNADWFPHKACMRNDERIKALRNKFDLGGYAVYNMVLEYLTFKDHWKVEYTEEKIEDIAGDFTVKPEFLKDVIDYCVKKDLFQIEDGYLKCRKLQEGFDGLSEKRQRESERAEKRQRASNGHFLTTVRGVSAAESPHSTVQDITVHTNTVCVAVSEIFGRTFETDPQQRNPAFGNWYNEIIRQAKELLQTYGPEKAPLQVRAYIKHCKANSTKMINHPHKVVETIQRADWIALAAPEAVPRGDPYSEAKYWQSLLTPEAWREKYSHQIKTDERFRKTFQTTQ